MNTRILSQQTRDLLEQLEDLPARRWPLRRKGELLRLIKTIGDSTQMLAAPALLVFACHRNREIALQSALAIRRLLEDVAPGDLVFLDQYMRAASPWSTKPGSAGLITVTELDRMQVPEDCLLCVLGLASCHRDGFVREAAVRALSRCSSGAEISWLLIRANDWVAPIRVRAASALLARGNISHAAELVRNLPLMRRLHGLVRDDHQSLAQALESVVVSEAASAELRAAMSSADRVTRRACIELAVAHRKLSLCIHALSNHDPIVRLRAARLLFSSLPVDEVCSLAGELAVDKFARVRQEALRASIDRCPQAVRERINNGLLDENISVRRLAAYHARAVVRLDVAAFYRAHLALGSARHRAACIVGLGESGCREDVQLLRECLGDKSPRVRRSVLQALSLLDFDRNIDVFGAALVSDSAGLSRKACELLSRVPSLADEQTLEQAMLRSGLAHVRRNALKILARTGKWSGLRYSFLALRSDELLHDIARASVVRWLRDFNRRFTQPQAEDLRRIELLLAQIKDTLPAVHHAQIALILSSFRASGLN